MGLLDSTRVDQVIVVEGRDEWTVTWRERRLIELGAMCPYPHRRLLACGTKCPDHPWIPNPEQKTPVGGPG